MSNRSEVHALVKKYLPGQHLSGKGVTLDFLRKLLVAEGGLSEDQANGRPVEIPLSSSTFESPKKLSEEPELLGRFLKYWTLPVLDTVISYAVRGFTRMDRQPINGSPYIEPTNYSNLIPEEDLTYWGLRIEQYFKRKGLPPLDPRGHWRNLVLSLEEADQKYKAGFALFSGYNSLVSFSMKIFNTLKFEKTDKNPYYKVFFWTLDKILLSGFENVEVVTTSFLELPYYKAIVEETFKLSYSPLILEVLQRAPQDSVDLNASWLLDLSLKHLSKFIGQSDPPKVYGSKEAEADIAERMHIIEVLIDLGVNETDLTENYLGYLRWLFRGYNEKVLKFLEKLKA